MGISENLFFLIFRDNFCDLHFFFIIFKDCLYFSFTFTWKRH